MISPYSTSASGLPQKAQERRDRLDGTPTTTSLCQFEGGTRTPTPLALGSTRTPTPRGFGGTRTPTPTPLAIVQDAKNFLKEGQETFNSPCWPRRRAALGPARDTAEDADGGLGLRLPTLGDRWNNRAELEQARASGTVSAPPTRGFRETTPLPTPTRPPPRTDPPRRRKRHGSGPLDDAAASASPPFSASPPMTLTEGLAPLRIAIPDSPMPLPPKSLSDLIAMLPKNGGPKLDEEPQEASREKEKEEEEEELASVIRPETRHPTTCSEFLGSVMQAGPDCDYWDNASQFGDRSNASQLFNDSDCSPSSSSPLGSQSHRPFGRSRFQSEDVEGLVSPSGATVIRGATISWVRGELIGRGSLGTVWKGLNRKTGQLMAVKEVASDAHDKSEEIFRTSLQNEISLYKDLQHPNIVSYLGNDYINGRLYIYLEYMPGGSIAQVLSQFGKLEEPLIARYTVNLLHGLEYLHTRDPPVLHRDIKGANILVGMDRTVKLSDFGCSKRTAGTAVHTLRGSVPWMAPEVMRQSGYGRKADIWSLGCVLIEMSTGSPPWGQFDNCLAAMVRIAMSEETPPMPEHLSPECRDFVSLCTSRAPEERPSATQLLDHGFVTSSAALHAAEEWA